MSRCPIPPPRAPTLRPRGAGEETKNPLKAIPRAVLLTVALCAVYHTLVGIAQYTAFASSAAWGDDEGALLTLVRTRVSPALAAPVFLAAAVDGFAGNIACVNAIARVGLHMARDGALPRWLGVVHQRCAAAALVEARGGEGRPPLTMHYRTGQVPHPSRLLAPRLRGLHGAGRGVRRVRAPGHRVSAVPRYWLGAAAGVSQPYPSVPTAPWPHRMRCARLARQIVYVILSVVALRDASWTHKLELVRFGPRDGVARNWFGERCGPALPCPAAPLVLLPPTGLTPVPAAVRSTPPSSQCLSA